MKLLKIVPTTTCIVATLFYIAMSTGKLNAQETDSDSASLGQMHCQNLSSNGGFFQPYLVKYVPISENILIDRNEVLTGVGYLGASSPGLAGSRAGIRPSEEADSLICGLDSSYTTLTLAFGFNARDVEDERNQSAVVKFAVYKDGENSPYHSEFLRMGDRLRWEIDVTDSPRVRLEVQCLGTPGVRSCPGLYFFQDTLQ
jgi:hypothetical protein